jgi:RNA polymerase sigma-70 factor (ECF subfamily)
MEIEHAASVRWWAWSAARETDWDAVYREQLPRVFNYLRFRVGDDSVAEDLTSATFERAWVARLRYRRDLASFGTWLHAIARNLAIDHLRARRPHVPLEAAAELAGADDPAERAGRNEEFEKLGRLLERLPDRERDIVALKFGAGWTNRAIGRALNLSETNVGTILHRTIQGLRAGWEGAP